MPSWRLVVCGLMGMFISGSAFAQDPKPDTPPPAATPDQPPANIPGHSLHGEAFNEGPRQRAYLMKGMGKIRFPVSTKSSTAQKFFEQGVAQLHGFWYFEAERSFRQAAAIDPTCAMFYWGMAMANVNNDRRAKEFIQEAIKRKAAATEREKLWIDSLAVMYEKREKGGEKKQRLLDSYRIMRRICAKYPDDLEAKAFLACIQWENQYTTPFFLRSVMDASLKSVLAQNPMHPLHHYRIHIWDGGKSERALDSAARCGQSSAGIAHMWHMPGHIFHNLKRYSDATWQQEAGVRVDNAQLIRDRILPDQIHNYAHNSEWLARSMINVGRVHDAVTLCKNMIEMPRHPKFNTIDRGSTTSGYGRLRLIQVLTTFEMWEEILALADTVYLEPTGSAVEKINRLKTLATAAYATGDRTRGDGCLAQLEALGKTEGDAKPPYNFEQAVAEVRLYKALEGNDKVEADKQLGKINGFTAERKAWVQLKLGNLDKAEQLALEGAKRKNEVQPLAQLVEVLYRANKKEEAQNRFKELQALSTEIDMDLPIFRRITEIAPGLGCSGSWKVVSAPASDVGKRPNLDSLGPFRWTPTRAPGLSLPDADGKKVSLDDYRRQGKPVLVIFYLGSGCVQCMEQLNIFSPLVKDFEKAGISLVAVSTDTVEGLKKTFSKEGADKRFPFPLLSDTGHKTYKAFRAYDDFEKMPLHGCYLIDGEGYLRWQDISFEPFKQPKFLLDEAQRLLKIPAAANLDRVAAARTR